jgi:CHRD domain-containing protein
MAREIFARSGCYGNWGNPWEDAMNKLMHIVWTIALVIGFGIATASAETVTLKADLKGSNEVPPNSSPASGKAEATLNTETKVLTWTVTYKDLTGPAVGAHFHGPSEPGKNAGIVLPFKTTQSPIEGTATLTDAQMADLLAGKWYANIHTAANPGGELRGNMAK